MAFPTLNAQQEINNRKILEDLQLKKQQLILQKGLMQVNPPPAAGPQQLQSDLPVNIPTSNQARAAWQQANNQSFGFFIPQDSVFGNNILPVLPRFDSSPAPPK